MNKVSYGDLLEYLNDNTDILRDMVNEVNSYNGSLEDYMWYENDSWFYEDFFSSKEDVARAVFYGGSDYDYTDEYVRFDVYGNLETTSEYDMISDLRCGIEEILDTFLELYANNNVNTYDNVFKDMISNYYSNKESEEDL